MRSTAFLGSLPPNLAPLEGVVVVAKGMPGFCLQQLLGGLAFALSFRREAFAALGDVYTAARAAPRQKPLRLSGQVADDVLAALV